ncbi:hypothetical protein [Streptomyces sp. NPDC058985]|uniref:hypothetical protein n=1 Tax=Streptomyces sp. NPDC058985 TaxID=3346684 RepID=UPI0036B7817B
MQGIGHFSLEDRAAERGAGSGPEDTQQGTDPGGFSFTAAILYGPAHATFLALLVYLVPIKSRVSQGYIEQTPPPALHDRAMEALRDRQKIAGHRILTDLSPEGTESH